MNGPECMFLPISGPENSDLMRSIFCGNHFLASFRRSPHNCQKLLNNSGHKLFFYRLSSFPQWIVTLKSHAKRRKNVGIGFSYLWEASLNGTYKYICPWLGILFASSSPPSFAVIAVMMMAWKWTLDNADKGRKNELENAPKFSPWKSQNVANRSEIDSTIDCWSIKIYSDFKYSSCN